MISNNSNNMHVIMTYHTLQTRNPRFTHLFWEVSVLIGLLLIMGFGIMGNLTLQRILDTYEDQNIFSAELVFIPKSGPENETDKPWNIWAQANTTNTTIKTSTPTTTIRPPESNVPYYKRDLTELLEFYDYEKLEEKSQPINYTFSFLSLYSNTSGNDTENNKTRSYEEELEADYEFISEMKLDHNKTIYGVYYLRDYMVFYPLLCSIVAVQWFVILYNFRSGGYINRDWKNSRPWQLVIPSIFVYAIMTMVTATYKYYSVHYFGELCTNLGKNLTHPEKFSCGYLMDNLYCNSWQELELLMSTSHHYDIYRSAVTITLILWILVLIIVIVRWILAVDFRLFRVTIFALVDPKMKVEKKSSKIYIMQVDGPNDVLT